ncbi:MAG: diguanylate cyclase [Anaerolineales bacterium]|nr:diguanylate cyclase [Anaerolineales bacterium]MCZ2288290.1 diguanylate cyclase [Anaerolineales bacterium]
MNDDLSKILLDNLSDGVYYVDKDRNITYWNTTAEKITGYQKPEIIGHSCANNILRHMDVTGRELCENGCPLQLTLQDGEKREAFVFLHHKQGHRVSVHVRVAPLVDETGEIIGAVETFSENSKNLDMLKEIERLKNDAFRDPLLGIGNRRLAEIMFENHADKRDVLGMIFFDVDFFKEINDQHGHTIGDKTLVMISKSAISALRQSDLFFRWGGDEFLILLPNISREDLRAIAERINIFVERSFIMADNRRISTTISTSATFAAANETLASAIKRSDALMYKSKNDGRNKVTAD